MKKKIVTNYRISYRFSIGLVTLLVATFLSSTVRAISNTDSNPENDLLISVDSKNQPSMNSEAVLPVEDGAVAIVYNPKAIDTEPAIAMQSTAIATEVIIPEGPSNAEEADRLKDLSDAERNTFLSKKSSFLHKFTKVLSFVRLKPKFINKALVELNSQFFHSPSLIARANTTGISVMFSVSGGLALPQKFTEFLKARAIGKFLPATGGFYYLLGLGFGVVRRVDPHTNKSSLYLESFVDTESLKKTLTGIVEVSAAGTYGVVYESRPDSFWSQKFESTYGGVAGIFKKGESQFGWSASTGLSFPPGIGAVLVYQDSGTRRYFVRMNLTKYVINPLSMAIKYLSFGRLTAGRCESLLLK